MYILSIAILGLTHMMIAFADTPPACLLSAIGAQPNPADVRLICGKLQEVIYSDIKEKCSGNGGPSVAMGFFAATCFSEASIKVDVKNADVKNADVKKNNTDPVVYSTANNDSHTSPTTYHAPTPSTDMHMDPSVAQSSTSSTISATSTANYHQPLTIVNMLCAGIVATFML